MVKSTFDWVKIENEYFKNNNKPSTSPREGKGNKIMSNVVSFFNDLTISAEDKELKKAGLKDSNLNWTIDARDIVLDLEAKERGYKNWEKLGQKFNTINFTSLEVEELFKKFYDKLLETAKKFNKNNDKK